MINLRTPVWVLCGFAFLACMVAGFVLAMMEPELPLRIRASATGALDGWQRAVTEHDASSEGMDIESYLHARLDTLEAENQVLLMELANATALIEASARALADAERKTDSLGMLAADLVQQVAAEPYIVPAEEPEHDAAADAPTE
ncbi:MAG: hypothetical protein NCW75_14020 [Phycisphaera sp.]|nr:MAG: hypothetical protein NCW75_14020 [Phycisphaera sp.]